MRRRVLIGATAIAVPLLLPALAFAQEYSPQNEFQHPPWIPLIVNTPLGPIDFSINKFVFYLLLVAGLTIVSMLWLARRMEAKPNRVQMAVEMFYDLTNNQMTRGNLNARMSARWFAFIATIFVFILFSNLVGYIPMPVNTEFPIDFFGLFEFPTFQIYATTANFSLPLALTLLVFVLYNVQGVIQKGPIGYLKGLMPPGVPKPAKPVVFSLECLSQLVRIVSLSVRLFANLLAGHLLIILTAGGIIVILGKATIALVTIPIGATFYIFESTLIAGLQAYIFAILTAIYLGEAVAEEH